jgi:hypothetical protein
MWNTILRKDATCIPPLLFILFILVLFILFILVLFILFILVLHVLLLAVAVVKRVVYRVESMVE